MHTYIQHHTYIWYIHIHTYTYIILVWYIHIHTYLSHTYIHMRYTYIHTYTPIHPSIHTSIHPYDIHTKSIGVSLVYNIGFFVSVSCRVLVLVKKKKVCEFELNKPEKKKQYVNKKFNIIKTKSTIDSSFTSVRSRGPERRYSTTQTGVLGGRDHESSST